MELYPYYQVMVFIDKEELSKYSRHKLAPAMLCKNGKKVTDAFFFDGETSPAYYLYQMYLSFKKRTKISVTFDSRKPNL